MGRKKLSAAEARQKPLRIRLNERERQLVDRASKADGFHSTSAWARLTLVNSAQKPLEQTTFPVYLLQLGEEWKVVFPENRRDIGHTEFWERTVSHIVALHFGIHQTKLANLPYCQRRARIVGNKVYYGETHKPELLDFIRDAVGNEELVFCHDDHEKRLREDLLQFRKLAARYRPKSTIT